MRIFFLALFFSFLLPTMAKAQKWEEPTWSYFEDTGPHNWGKYEKFKLCSLGKNQSPINIFIDDAEKDKNLPVLKFAYQPNQLNFINNGNFIEAEVTGESKVFYGDDSFTLTKIEFHTPSEHLFQKKPYSMEIELIHKGKENKMLVVSILVKRGKMNYGLKEFLNHIPEKSQEKIQVHNRKINPLDFFPPGGGYYTYEGSLTSPPCTENVRWIILSQFINVSIEQLQNITLVHRISNRPIQALNRREYKRKP